MRMASENPLPLHKQGCSDNIILKKKRYHIIMAMYRLAGKDRPQNMTNTIIIHAIAFQIYM